MRRYLPALGAFTCGVAGVFVLFGSGWALVAAAALLFVLDLRTV